MMQYSRFASCVASACCFALTAIISTRSLAERGQETVEFGTPEEVVAYFLTTSDCGWPSDERKALTERVARNPALYSEPIAQALRFPENLALLAADEQYLRIGRALWLASLLGTDHGAKLVRACLEQATARLNAHTTDPREKSGMVRQNVQQLRQECLEILRRFGDPHAVDSCIATIEGEEVPTQVVMLEYLAVVAPHDQRLKAPLTRIVNDKSSYLYRNKLGLRLLEELDEAPTTTAPSPTSQPAGPAKEEKPKPRGQPVPPPGKPDDQPEKPGQPPARP